MTNGGEKAVWWGNLVFCALLFPLLLLCTLGYTVGPNSVSVLGQSNPKLGKGQERPSLAWPSAALAHPKLA